MNKNSVQSFAAEPIAIVGMGCRFPGADSPAAFWDLLRKGEETISEIPPDRFDLEALYHPEPATPGRVMSKWGGFLEGIDRFDASFFGISPREAAYMDPQQRLLLEVAWEALEDAGQVVGDEEAEAGVFVGLWLNEYESRMFEATEELGFYMTTGSGRYAASGRLSYALGLRGPSLTVDTACSSSLVAVHLACQSLHAGECELALAGAANVILQPFITVAYSQSKMMAPDGRCKFGDADADGYVRSEGAAVLVLKRLADALADGDDVYAVIHGSAVNNDGRGGGYLATPSQTGQEDLLRKAYRAAGVDPRDVQYVEAHGTGTRAGDPVEVGAIGAVLGAGRPRGAPVRVGSVKTNIGHTEGAAGLAGVIKTALAIRHRTLPASLHQRQPNHNIPWEDLRVAVQREATGWPNDRKPLIAGVSAFGITGTNGHVVLGEAPPSDAEEAEESSPTRAQLVPLSARSVEALTATARSYSHWIARTEGGAALSDVGRTAALRRTHHEHRLAFVADDVKSLKVDLDAFVEGAPFGAATGRVTHGDPAPIAFVFPGQGAQWLGMGQQLYAHAPVFKAAIDRCHEAIAPHVTWSLLEELQAGPAQSRLDAIDVVQPTLFAIQVALADLWRSWGIEPAAIVGHSMGEVAAAHVAGALPLEDAARVICWRSKLMKEVRGQGAMAVVELSLEEAAETLVGYEDRLSVAVSSGPRSVVLAGDPDALDEVLDALEQLEVFCRRVKVDVASHSPHMDPLAPRLVEALSGVQAEEARIPIYSTVEAKSQPGTTFGAEYWGHNLRNPVRFAETIQQLAEAGPHLFIEMSPHPLLQQAILSTLQHADPDAADRSVVLPSLRREEDERACMLSSLAALYVRGVTPDWERVYPKTGSPVKLPSYPWQRERFWYTDVERTPPRRRAPSEEGRHLLLGPGLQSGVHHATYLWPLALSAAADSFIAGRRVGERIPLSEAALVDAVLAGASGVLTGGAEGRGGLRLEDVQFDKPLSLTQSESLEAQLVLAAQGADTWSFRVVGRARSEGESAWTDHALGTVRSVSPTEWATGEGAVHAANGVPEEGTPLSAEAHYESLRNAGIACDEPWQALAQLRVGRLLASAEATVPTVLGQDPTVQIHPVLLEAGAQLLGRLASGGAYGLAGFRSLRVARPLPTDGTLRVFARATSEAEKGEQVDGDITFVNEAGEVCLEARGVRLRRLDHLRTTNADRFLYEVEWVEQELDPESHSNRRTEGQRAEERWVIFADRGGVGEAVATLLEECGGTCTLVWAATGNEQHTSHIDAGQPEAYVRLLEDLRRGEGDDLTGLLYLWGLDAPAPEDVGGVAIEQATSVLYLAQALVQVGAQPRLWLVTQNVHRVTSEEPVSIVQAPISGMGLGIAYDHPELRCTCVDLSGVGGREAAALVEEVLADGREDRIALRGERRWVARLSPYAALSTNVSVSEAPVRLETQPAGDDAFELTQFQGGVLNAFGFRRTSRRPPGSSEVEIEVGATGLNFLDVLKALRAYPGQDDEALPTFGAECAGRIRAVGSDVEDLRPGDEVMAISPDLDNVSCFGGTVTVPAELAVRTPPWLALAEAASVPIAFLTAYYALHRLGRLEKGERVLIHSAAGGVGLAAVQLAQRAGAEIFATAGTEEKRAYLRELGLLHVMDSRTLAFAEEVMVRTGGRGVDVVLNSLTGEALRKSLSVLAPYGRFLEIGKRDLYENSQVGLAPFQRSLSFFSIDLARLIRERPHEAAGMLREIVGLVEAGEVAPLPVYEVAAGQVADAFRHFAQAEHIGKVAVRLAGEQVSITHAHPQGEIRADATYLVTGGLGGLGLGLTRWLVERGARHLCLIGRSRPSLEARDTLDALRQKGVEVRVESADVTRAEDVSRVLRGIEQRMPPLRGVFHAAGTLDDGVVENLTPDQVRRVMDPKLGGAWHLHLLTQPYPLDHFVLFSSVASVVGLPGQSNYVAANAGLDAVARYRAAHGQPALSVQWGPWAAVGLAAARADRGDRLDGQGVGSIAPEEGWQVLGRLLNRTATEVAVVPLNVRRWGGLHPAASAPFFERLLDKGEAEDAEEHVSAGILSLLRTAETPRQRESLLHDHVRVEVGHVLRLTPDRIDLETPFKSMGLDSLMTIELRNRLQSSLQLRLSATLVWNYPNIFAMSRHLLARLQAERLEGEAEAGEPSGGPASVLALGGNELGVDELSEMTEDEAQALLDKKLTLIDGLEPS